MMCPLAIYHQCLLELTRKIDEEQPFPSSAPSSSDDQSSHPRFSVDATIWTRIGGQCIQVRRYCFSSLSRNTTVAQFVILLVTPPGIHSFAYPMQLAYTYPPGSWQSARQ